MLQRLRDKISGWFAGVVIALIAGAFILWGVEFYFEQGGNNQDTAATVNGVVISQAQINQLVSQLQARISAQYGNKANLSELAQQLKSYALESIVTQTALLTTFEKQGFQVGMTQIKMAVEQAPEFQDNGQFSEAKLMQALYAMQLSPLQFFQQMKSRWIVNQVMQTITVSAFALPNETQDMLMLQNQQRAFGYMVIPSSLFLSKITISDAAVKSEYTVNQSLYETPAQVSVDYIVLSPTAIEKTVTVTDADAKQYYDSHMTGNNAKAPAFESVKSKIIALLQHQRVGKLLSQQASQLSDLTYTNPDSLATASKALHLPIQTSPMMTKSGEKTGIFANPKVLAAIFSDSVFHSNNNSDPISLPDGSQVVLRIAKKEPSAPIPLEKVAPQIKKALIEKQATARAGLLAYQLQTKLSQGDHPEILAKENHLTWQTTPLSARNAKSSVPPAIVTAAFSTPVKQAKTISLKDGYAVVMVAQAKNSNSTEASADTKKIAAQFSAMWAQLMQHCMVTSVMAHSKIVVKQ